MGGVQKVEGTKTAVSTAVYSVIDDPRNLDVSIKLNRDTSVKELIRELFKIPKGGEVSPWHVEVFKQINPEIIPEKSNLSFRIKADSKIRLGDLGYEISKERAEKLIPAYKEALENPGLKNREEIEKALSYLEKKIEQKPPEFLLKTSQIEAKVAALFSTKKATQEIGDWIRDIESDRGIKRPTQNLAENIKSLTTTFDAYIYSLPEGERHRGAKQAVNLAERISSAYGIELTEWQLARAKDWSLKTEEATKRRYIIQLTDKLITEHEVSRNEKDSAEKAARDFNNPTKSAPAISKKGAIESLYDFEARQVTVTNRVSDSWRQVDKYSIENQVQVLDKKWKEIEKGASSELRAEFLKAKSELLSLEKNPQAAITAKFEALQTLIGSIPGIKIDNGKAELETAPISKKASVELYAAITGLSEDKKRVVNQLVSSLVAALVRQAESPTNADKERILKQVDVGMQLLLATTHTTPTAQLEYRGYQAKIANLNGKTDEALRLYQETRKYCEGLVMAGVASVKSTYQAISREEALLISQQEPSSNNTKKIAEIIASVERDLPKSRAFQAELKLLEVQAVLQDGDFNRGRTMLSAMAEKFSDLPQVVKDVSKLSAEKSDSQLLSGIKTALGSWGKSSMLEAALYSGGGALLGAFMAGPLGAATGAKIGLAIGVLTLAGKNMYEDRHKIYSSYQTGLAAVGSAMAVTLLASAILDLTGAGKAGGVGLRLTKQLVTEVGAAQVAKALLKGESKEITKTLLRNGLGETAYASAAEKGEQYLETKASEFIRRIFKQAGKAVQDAPLQSSLGSGMFLNQGREIIVQLYAVATDDTLTPAQKENGYKQVALQLAELVAFMGTVHTVTRKLDNAADAKIAELRSTSKSVVRENTPVEVDHAAAVQPNPLAPIRGWDEPVETVTGVNLSRPGFGMPSLFGQRFSLAMNEPVDGLGGGPVGRSAKQSETNHAQTVLRAKEKILGLLSPVEDADVIRSLEKDFSNLGLFISKQYIAPIIDSQARRIIEVVFTRVPNKATAVMAMPEFAGDILPQILSNMLEDTNNRHVQSLREMPAQIRNRTIEIAQEKGFLENPAGQLVLASVSNASVETFITAARNAYQKGDEQTLGVAYEYIPNDRKREFINSLLEMIAIGKKGSERITEIRRVGQLLSGEELAKIKASLEKIDDQKKLTSHQEVQLLTFLLFQNRLVEGNFSGSVFRKLIKSDLMLEEKEAALHSILRFDPDDPDVDERYAIIGDKITNDKDFSVVRHTVGALGQWLADLKDPVKLSQIEFVGDILSGVPDELTRCRLLDSLAMLREHPDPRTLWSREYSKIPPACFLRFAEVVEWNPIALRRLNDVCAKFASSSEATEFIQSAESLFLFAPEYKKIVGDQIANLTGTEFPKEVLRFIRNLNTLKNANLENPVAAFRKELHDFDNDLLDENPIYAIIDGEREMPTFKVEDTLRSAIGETRNAGLLEVNRKLDGLVDRKIQFYLPNMDPEKIQTFREYWDDVSVPLTYLARYPENQYIKGLLSDDRRRVNRGNNTLIKQDLERLIGIKSKLSPEEELFAAVLGNRSEERAPPTAQLMQGTILWRRNQGVQREALSLGDNLSEINLTGEAKSLANVLVSDRHHAQSTSGPSHVFSNGFEIVKPVLEQINSGTGKADFAAAKQLIDLRTSALEVPIEAFNSTQKAESGLKVLQVKDVKAISPKKLEGSVNVYKELGGTDAAILGLNPSNVTPELVDTMIEYFNSKKAADQQILSAALRHYSLPVDAQGIRQLVAIRKEMGAASSLINLLESLSSGQQGPEKIMKAQQEISQLKNYFAKTQFRADIDNLSQTIDNLASASVAPRNVVTFFTDDKRMMMQIGKYPSGTCQHYETGVKAEALPAYVGDWFIKGVFVIDVERAGLNQNQLAQLREGKIPDGVKPERLLKSTIGRSVVKYGVSNVGEALPGVFIEKPYSLLGDKANKVFGDIIAEDMLNLFKATAVKVVEAGDADEPILIPASRNDYGQYEDADADEGKFPDGKVIQGDYTVYGRERKRTEFTLQ